jgi:hypothetical protein
MAQFQTPQFIEHEAKVIGPLTFRRAGYIGAPLALIFVLYFAMAADNFIVFVALSVVLEGIGVALAFAKVEGKSIPTFLINAVFFFMKPQTYIWKRGKISLHYKEADYVNPLTEGQGGLRKEDLTRVSKVADLSVKVQTKK